MVIWASALLLSGQPVSNAEVGAIPTPLFDRCLDTGDAAKGVTSAQQACIGEEYSGRDVVLNREYRQQMAKRSLAAQSVLRKRQRAWLIARKRNCEHAGDDSKGGSLQQIEISDCYLTETMRRTIWLKR